MGEPLSKQMWTGVIFLGLSIAGAGGVSMSVKHPSQDYRDLQQQRIIELKNQIKSINDHLIRHEFTHK